MKTLVLFDFDGTITTRDSMLDLARFHAGSIRYYISMLVLSPLLLSMKLKIISNSITKEIFLGLFFGSMNEHEFMLICKAYTQQKLPVIIRSAAMIAIQQHQQNGHQVVVVSASAKHWLDEWCKQQSLLLCCTELEVENGKITGKLKGPNCNGAEKVNRIKARFDLSQYEKIIAYGDSSGDAEMFAISHEHHYKPFRKN